MNTHNAQRETHARASDPITSHEAAARNEPRRPNQIVQVAQLVRENPGHTSAELAYLCDRDRYMVARRLSDARDKNLVFPGTKKTCEINRGAAVTWWPRRFTPLEELGGA